MSFRAKVQKWSGLPWFDFSNLMKWLPLRVGSNILANQNLQIVSVTNECNETVCYVPFENVLVAQSYAVAPGATPSEKSEAGDAVDCAIEREARKNGIRKVWLVLTDDHEPTTDERVIRVVEREIEQVATVPEVGFTASAQATQYLN